MTRLSAIREYRTEILAHLKGPRMLDLDPPLSVTCTGLLDYEMPQEEERTKFLQRAFLVAHGPSLFEGQTFRAGQGHGSGDQTVKDGRWRFAGGRPKALGAVQGSEGSTARGYA